MTVSECLERAAELIEPEGKWCQGELAKDEYGDVIRPHLGAACSWCMEGAIVAVLDGKNSDADVVYDFVRDKLKLGSLFEWNDDAFRTQRQVVEALRKAADLAKQEGR